MLQNYRAGTGESHRTLQAAAPEPGSNWDRGRSTFRLALPPALSKTGEIFPGCRQCGGWSSRCRACEPRQKLQFATRPRPVPDSTVGCSVYFPRSQAPGMCNVISSKRANALRCHSPPVFCTLSTALCIHTQCPFPCVRWDERTEGQNNHQPPGRAPIVRKPSVGLWDWPRGYPIPWPTKTAPNGVVLDDDLQDLELGCY